ncbi:MAG: hypothetical protein J4G19_06395 [Pseudomonadales bacterium]|nr:hypothetical protein [Pseudomonadales bacterium]
MQNLVRSSGVYIHGVGVDQRTGCAHYRSAMDVVAIRHHCCGEWYACTECHSELANHDASVWPQTEFDTLAVLCGVCGHQVSIRTYLANSDHCVACGRSFNPGCRHHHHLYFEK